MPDNAPYQWPQPGQQQPGNPSNQYIWDTMVPGITNGMPGAPAPYPGSAPYPGGGYTNPSDMFSIFGLTPANNPGPVQPGPWSPQNGGLVTYDQAGLLNQIANTYGLSPDEVQKLQSTYNQYQNYYQKFYQPQLDQAASQADYIRQLQSLAQGNYQNQKDALYTDYALDNSRNVLQGQVLDQQKSSIDNMHTYAQQLGQLEKAGILDDKQVQQALYDAYKANNQSQIGSIDKYRAEAAKQLASSDALNARNRTSAGEARDTSNATIGLTETSGVRHRLYDTFAAGAAISGGTHADIGDIHTSADLGRQSVARQYADAIAALTNQYNQSHSAYNNAMTGYDDQARNLQYGIDTGQTKLDATLRGDDRALYQNQINQNQETQQYQDAVFNNYAQQQGLKINGKQLASTLQRGLDQLGYSNSVNAAQLANMLNSNDYQQREIAMQIMDAALQASGAYASSLMGAGPK